VKAPAASPCFGAFAPADGADLYARGLHAGGVDDGRGSPPPADEQLDVADLRGDADPDFVGAFENRA